VTSNRWDREPTSDAERVRWRVGASVRWRRAVNAERDRRCVWLAEGHVGPPLALFATEGLAAEAVWAHNVMVAAREQAAMRADDKGAT
jgi:hypothetical protein